MRVPGGGASCLGVGRPGSGALPPPTTRPFGRAAGAHYPLAVGAGVQAWGPVTNPTARALASWLCALWEHHEGAGGRRLLPGCGASGVGCSPTPDHSSVPACGRGPLSTGCGCGGCGHGDPSPIPRRALVSWLCELRGRHEGAQGRRLLPVCGASGDGRSPTPDLSSLRACGRGPLPTGCGCGGCGRGDPSPTPQRALLRAGFAHCGGGTRLRGGGSLLPGCGASGVGRSPTPDHLSFQPCGRGPLPTGCGCGGCGRGDPSLTRQRTLLRAGFARCGGATRVPGGGASCLGVGRPGTCALPPLTSRPFGVRPGPTTHWLWVRGVRAWGPVTNPTARTLASWLRALWGRHEGAGGGSLLPGCGASGVGRSPTPDHLSFQPCGRGPLPTGCGCGGCGRGDPSLTRQRTLLRAGFARCGGATRVPGGGASCLGVGRPGTCALPPLTSRPFGVRPGPTTHWLWVRGVRAWGPVATPHSARSCELALRAVGAA